MNDEILSYEAFIHLVINALDTAGIDYMIGGAVATWAWGEPRATIDLDIVVNIPLDGIQKLSIELRKRDMLVSEEIILDNILEDRVDLPIIAIHMHSVYKADLYPLREGDSLRATALGRRRKIDLGAPLGEVYLHSPEDLIIYKLWYFSINQQSKHVRDITSIVLTLEDDLDYDYIEKWADAKGVINIWRELDAKIQSRK
jgi:hypothetical protein